MSAPQLTQYALGTAAVTADGLNTFEQTCDNFSQLRTFSGTQGMQVFARGRTSPGDQFGGVFYWVATSTATDDNLNVITPSGNASAGRWIRINFVGGGSGPPGPTIYPSAGIPNSTGSTWGTSYSTTGTGTSVALATGPTLNTPVIASGGMQYTPQASAPTYAEGLVWWDSNQHALSYYSDVIGNILTIGQETQVKVINNTGSTIANGAPVYVTGTSSGQAYPNVALAQANTIAASSVLGLTNGSIANGSVGYVTTAGIITGVSTGSFTVGTVLYLSPYSAGQIQGTPPPTGYSVQIGVVSYSNSPNGSIYVKQTTPLSVTSGSIANLVTTASVSFTESATTGQKTIIVTGAAVTVTLPTAVGNTAQLTYKLSVAGTLTLTPQASQTIDGSSSVSVSTQYTSITIVSDNSNWWVT